MKQDKTRLFYCTMELSLVLVEEIVGSLGWYETGFTAPCISFYYKGRRLGWYKTRSERIISLHHVALFSILRGGSNVRPVLNRLRKGSFTALCNLSRPYELPPHLAERLLGTIDAECVVGSVSWLKYCILQLWRNMSLWE